MGKTVQCHRHKPKQIYEEHLLEGHPDHPVLCFAEECEDVDLLKCLNNSFFLP